MPGWLHNGVGLAGTGLILLAYALIQTGRMRAENPAYSVINGAGAAMILFSLIFEFNLAAFVMEVFWLLISAFGLYRGLRARQGIEQHGP